MVKVKMDSLFNKTYMVSQLTTWKYKDDTEEYQFDQKMH